MRGQTGFKLAGTPAGPVFWVVGNQIAIKAGGADTAGAYAVFEITVPPGAGTPPHVHHREDEAFYVLEGELT